MWQPLRRTSQWNAANPPFRVNVPRSYPFGRVGSEPSDDWGSTIEAVASSKTPEPRLVACPACGAPNAASRLQCARCAIDLHGDPAQSGVEAGGLREGEPVAEPEGPSTILVVATVIALVAGIGVMIAILSAQGLGPFAPDVADVLSEVEAAEVVEVRSSSEREPGEDREYGGENVVDGETRTAWVAAGSAPEWLELELAEVTEVVGIVIWNGFQDDDRFARHDRVSSLRIETDDRRFSVDLLDTRGPLVVDLPEPVPASRLRLVAEEVFSGDEIEGPAMSLVEVRTRP